MKKTITTVLVVLMLASSMCVFAEDAPVLISAPAKIFTDVAQNDWAYAEIMAMADLGIAISDEAGRLNASNPVTLGDLSSLPQWTERHTKAAAEKLNLANSSPEKQITRAEFVWAIITAINATSEYNGSSFADVTDDAWYAKNLECAKSLGIIKGYEDGTFRGEGAVSKREALVMLCRTKAFLDVLSVQ